MASSVRLDSTSWGPEAQARLASMASARLAHQELASARQAHPLAGALDGLSVAVEEATGKGVLRFKVLDFGNGHVEACAWRHVPDPSRTLDRAIDRDLTGLTVRGEGDREKSIESAVRRAKQKVRHLAKAMIVNSLWTLTYRDNVSDRGLVLTHLDAFRRRVNAVLGDWRYIAVLERQERGAFHIHLATHELPGKLVIKGVRLKSWDVMRSIWRSIVGELGGNFDEAKRKKWGRGKGTKPIRGSGAIASYVAGYVAKDMQESELNRKRYSATKGVDIPPAYKALFPPETPWHKLIELAYAACGANITRRWFDPISGVFFVESDDTIPIRSGP